MKLKEQKKLSILYLVLGAVLFLVGLLTDAGEKTNWLSSFGSAIAVVAIPSARSATGFAAKSRRRIWTDP